MKPHKNLRFISILIFIFIFTAACAVKTKPSSEAKKEVCSLRPSPYSAYLKANVLAMEGQDLRSIEELENLEKEYADVAYLNYRLAGHYAILNQVEAALKYCNKALESNPDFVEALFLKARLKIAVGNNKEAITLLEKVLKIDAENKEAYLELTKVYLAQKEYNKSIAVLNKLVQVDPEDSIAYYHLGIIYAAAFKNYNLAVQMYQKALKEDPDDEQALSAIAQIHLEQDKKELALKELLALEGKLPDDMSTKLKIALLYYELGRYKDSIAAFEKMIELYPQSDKIRYYLGILYEAIKDYASSAREFSLVPSKSMYFKDSIIHIIYAYQNQNMLDKAITILDSAIKKKPDVPEFYTIQSQMLVEKGEWLKASKVLEKALKMNSKAENMHFFAGIVYDKLKMYDKSLYHMREVLKLNDKNGGALNYVGYTYAEQGINLDEAEKLVLRALELKPNDGFITDSLGWVYFKRGDLEKALKFIKKANGLAPKEPTVTEHMGDVYLKMGQKDFALKYFKEALQFLKEDEDAPQSDVERVSNKIKSLLDQ